MADFRYFHDGADVKEVGGLGGGSSKFENDTLNQIATCEAVESRPRARFELIEGADHFLIASLAEVGRIASSFLSREPAA